MQDMKSATFQGNRVTVKELTVKQVREVFERLNHEGHLFIDDLLDQPVPALVVTEATGIPLEQLEEALPSELITLCSEVIAVNPSLASMIKRRIEAFEKMEKVLHSGKTLTDQSAH